MDEQGPVYWAVAAATREMNATSRPEERIVLAMALSCCMECRVGNQRADSTCRQRPAVFLNKQVAEEYIPARLFM